jgi:hypothetical protein
MINRLIGRIRGWIDALLIALKLKKASVKSGSVDRTNGNQY